jgi:voltage-gated hydrogen channel 1
MASLNQRHDTRNYTPSGISEQSPLLPSIRQHLATSSERVQHVLGAHEEDSRLSRLRHSLRYFLSSKYGHYFVIILVSLDITCIFADFLISLHVCEHENGKGFNSKSWLAAEDVLGALSLAFSSLFMVELLASLFAFGFRFVCEWVSCLC